MKSDMTQLKPRVWRSHKQVLDGSLWGRSPVAAFDWAGWARSVGGVGLYLTTHARTGAAREKIDADGLTLAIRELPS